MSEIEAWVAFYEDQGLTYFPLYGISNGACRCKAAGSCQNPGKHPVFKWKGEPARSIRELDNVGISTDNLVVIDLDKADKSALSDYPSTFTTGTGNGFHLWYRADKSKNVKTFTAWRPHVDIRAVGGLIVAPPSRHISGGHYRHIQGLFIAPVPSEILAELPEKGTYKRKIHKVDNIAEETADFMKPVVDKLVSEMENHADGRNQTLFRVACRGIELVVSGVLGADALESIVDAALRTGLDREEIMKTLDSARKTV